jgi:hypothetical protein
VSNRKNDILDHLVTQILTIDTLVAERVHLGPVNPAIIGSTPHVTIVSDADRQEDHDANSSRRRFTIGLAVLMRVDPVAGAIDKQLNLVYDAIHAKFEALRDGAANLFLTLEEDSSGVQYDTIPDKTAIRLVASTWNITFDRAVATT